MQQQRFELQRQQQLDAANANAAEVYGVANPHGLSPADLEVAKAQIRNGNYNASQTIDALKAAGGYAANQAAANMIDAAHPEWSGSQRASAKADILSGRKNLSEVETDFANAGITTNKSSATIDATNQARTAATSPNAPANAALAAEAAANANPADAAKIIGQSKVLDQGAALPQNTPVNAPALTTLSTEQGIAGVPQTPPAQTAGPRAVADITGKTIVAQAAPRAPTAVVPPVAPIDPLTGQPIVVAPGAMPPSGVFSQPAQGPDTQATAASAGAESAAKSYGEDLTQAITDGGTALRLKTKLAQLRALSVIVDAGDTGQAPVAVIKWLADHDIVVGNRAEAYKAMDQILNTELPDLRKQMGIRFYAGPEIKAANKTIGSASLPPPVLNNIIANEEAAADIQIQKAYLAQQARYGQGADTISPRDYYKQAMTMDASIQDRTDALRKAYNAIGTETAPGAKPDGASLPAMKPDPANPGKWLHLDPATGLYAPR